MIRAAIELIARQGYYRTTLAEIVQESGRSQGLVSYRFGSNEGLLKKLVDRITQRFWNDQMHPASRSTATKSDFEIHCVERDLPSRLLNFAGRVRVLIKDRVGIDDVNINSALAGDPRHIHQASVRAAGRQMPYRQRSLAAHPWAINSSSDQQVPSNKTQSQAWRIWSRRESIPLMPGTYATERPLSSSMNLSPTVASSGAV